MTRPLRLQFPGAVYHVRARGNARAPIFVADAHCPLFLDLLGHTVERYGWYCHAYCLMPNHYHLLIETPQPTQARGMRHLNGVYTQRFNRRHGRVGHVFQGRYKAIVVQKDRHLVELCRYVVLNPVRASLVQTVAAWQWSSYTATAGTNPGPAWFRPRWVLAQFGRTVQRARRAYQRFVAEGLRHQPWEELKGQMYYGEEAFIKQLSQDSQEREIARVQRQPIRPGLAKVVPTGSGEEIARAYKDYGYRLRRLRNS
jgi:putative transposase